MTASATIYARAGLLGNPSDGYGGAAIGFTFDAMSAKVRCAVVDTPGFRFHWNDELLLECADLSTTLATPPTEPEHGAVRLVLAAVQQLDEGLDGSALVDAGGLHIDGSTTIPTQVGLAGSSAIVLATMHSLLNVAGRTIAPDQLAELALRAETELLGIAAGPLDRIAQARNGLHFMDFAAEQPAVTPIDVTDWPPLFLAWSPTPGEPSGVVHGDLRLRFDQRDPEVVSAIARFANIAREGQVALTEGNHRQLVDLFDENFALRQRIVGVSKRDRAMVSLARSAGASAKQCGSGGAILGIAVDAEQLLHLSQAYIEAGYGFCEPHLVPTSDGAMRTNVTTTPATPARPGVVR